jgi:anthrone oxygenase-like protein
VLIEHLAIVVAALFAGAAIYVTIAEQPARLALPDAAMLTQWQRSYPRAATMQASLALLGGILGLGAYWSSGAWLWVLGALVLLSAWPFTLIVIKPTNDALNATQATVAGAETRRLVERWGSLHAGRSGIGIAATLCYLLAAN